MTLSQPGRELRSNVPRRVQPESALLRLVRWHLIPAGRSAMMAAISPRPMADADQPSRL